MGVHVRQPSRLSPHDPRLPKLNPSVVESGNARPWTALACATALQPELLKALNEEGLSRRSRTPRSRILGE